MAATPPRLCFFLATATGAAAAVAPDRAAAVHTLSRRRRRHLPPLGLGAPFSSAGSYSSSFSSSSSSWLHPASARQPLRGECTRVTRPRARPPPRACSSDSGSSGAAPTGNDDDPTASASSTSSSPSSSAEDDAPSQNTPDPDGDRKQHNENEEAPARAPPAHPAGGFLGLVRSEMHPGDSIGDDESLLVSASGALQVDDGSLSEEESASFVVQHLRRKPSPRITRPASPFGPLLPVIRLPKPVMDAVILGTLFATWYWANTAFNIYNKQVLKVFPFPVTCTLIQFVVAAIVMSSLWLFKLKEMPRFSMPLLRSIVPLGILHAAGFLLTNMSLGKVSVAFTHTVKSTEPFFSVALTPSILGVIPTWGIVLSLVPIVAGVALASATEIAFNWIGFLSAVGSNVALQSRNVLSKKLMTDVAAGKATKSKRGLRGAQQRSASAASPLAKESGGLYAQSVLPMPVLGEAEEDLSDHDDIALTAKEEDALKRMDNVNLFAVMTMLAMALLAPVSLLLEGMPLLSPYAAQSVTGMATTMLLRKLGLGGICRCLDVLASYMILQRVSPVTHSVGNCVKRAVVIAFSIVFFKTKMTRLNILGTLLALAGVFVYSVVVSACKQNYFGPDSPFCKPIYEPEVELVEGGGI